GYQIVARNYRVSKGEFDIIARDGRTLLFIEVKTTAHHGFGDPAGWVDERKQEKIIHVAEIYLYLNGIQGIDCRFDVIALNKKPDGLKINHIQDAFS
ncbi:YraN family protein, partial [bacterium I07]